MPIEPGRIVSSEVLPGFRWRLDDLERKPPLETLMTDPVYQDFVLVNYQRELTKAAQAETKAAQAETKAAQAETKAAQAENQGRSGRDQGRSGIRPR